MADSLMEADCVPLTLGINNITNGTTNQTNSVKNENATEIISNGLRENNYHGIISSGSSMDQSSELPIMNDFCHCNGAGRCGTFRKTYQEPSSESTSSTGTTECTCAAKSAKDNSSSVTPVQETPCSSHCCRKRKIPQHHYNCHSDLDDLPPPPSSEIGGLAYDSSDMVSASGCEPPPGTSSPMSFLAEPAGSRLSAAPGGSRHFPKPPPTAQQHHHHSRSPHYHHRTAIISREYASELSMPLIQENEATTTADDTGDHAGRMKNKGSSSGPNLSKIGDGVSEQQQKETNNPCSFFAYVIDDPDRAYGQYMQARRVYDVIPVNTKFVVLDTGLNAKKAFYALIYNGVRSALLWNSKENAFCGLLTVTDFINILIDKYNDSPNHVIQNIDDQLIDEWRELLHKQNKLKPLVYVTVNDTMLRACQLLIETRFHRIPIFDDSGANALHFLTHKRILRYLYLVIDKLPPATFMQCSIKQLGIGTFENLLTIHWSTPLIECFQKLTSRNLSALPVLDDSGAVVDIYARFDAISVAAESTYDMLDKPIRETLLRRKKSKWYKGVITCLETDSLRFVVDKLYQHEVHGLVVVDKLSKLRGVLTLFDVLKFMIVDQMPPASPCLRASGSSRSSSTSSKKGAC